MLDTLRDAFLLFQFLMGDASPPLILVLMYVGPGLILPLFKDKDAPPTPGYKVSVAYTLAVMTCIVSIFTSSLLIVSNIEQFEDPIGIGRSAALGSLFVVMTVTFLGLMFHAMYSIRKRKRSK